MGDTGMSEYRTDPEHVLDPAVIRETLAGYAAANEVVEAERQRMLARLTREEALAIWRDLMKGFNEHPERQRHLDRLDLWQAEGLVALRRVLDRLAEARKRP
jgi:hypothetical protein